MFSVHRLPGGSQSWQHQWSHGWTASDFLKQIVYAPSLFPINVGTSWIQSCLYPSHICHMSAIFLCKLYFSVLLNNFGLLSVMTFIKQKILVLFLTILWPCNTVFHIGENKIFCSSKCRRYVSAKVYSINPEERCQNPHHCLINHFLQTFPKALQHL